MSARTASGLGAALAALFLIAAAPVQPESRLEQYFRLRAEAGEAAQAGDVAKAETALETALTLYPTSPGTLIRLARVEVAAGRPAEAVARLAAYADLGLTWDVAGDAALKALAARPDFAPVARRLAENAAVQGEALVVSPLGEPGDVYEGVVTQGDGWLVSSVAPRTIRRVTADGTIEPFLRPDAEIGGLFGMAVDEARGILWVAESRGPGIPGSSGEARTGLLKVSLKDGRILARHFAADDGKTHQLGDVAVDKDGAVYASDSVGAVIYRLKPGAMTLEPFVASREMASPQGMAICPDADAMVVADYSSGLHRIDLKTGAESRLGGLHQIALAGTDGLFRLPYDFAMRSAWPNPVALVATQNGISPQRMLFLRLSPDCRDLEGASVLAAGGPLLDDITLASSAYEGVVVIGSSGWAADGKPATDRPSIAKLLYLPLSRKALP